MHGLTIGKVPYDHIKPLEQSSIATKEYLLRTSKEGTSGIWCCISRILHSQNETKLVGCQLLRQRTVMA